MDAKGTAGAVEAWKFETNPRAWFKRVGLNRSDFSLKITAGPGRYEGTQLP